MRAPAYLWAARCGSRSQWLGLAVLFLITPHGCSLCAGAICRRNSILAIPCHPVDALQDSRVGTYALVGMALALQAKLAVLGTLGPARAAPALIAAHAASRQAAAAAVPCRRRSLAGFCSHHFGGAPSAICLTVPLAHSCVENSFCVPPQVDCPAVDLLLHLPARCRGCQAGPVQLVRPALAPAPRETP